MLLYCLVILPLLSSLPSLPSVLSTWSELFLSFFSLLHPPSRRFHTTFPFCLPFCLLFLGNRQIQLRESIKQLIIKCNLAIHITLKELPLRPTLALSFTLTPPFILLSIRKIAFVCHEMLDCLSRSNITPWGSKCSSLLSVAMGSARV